MKIGIVSHIVNDTIVDTDGIEIKSLGGPACYCSIIAKTFKIDVKLFTKVGNDILENLEILKENNIFIQNDQIDEKNPTTKFRLSLNKDGGRSLQLLDKCSSIDISYSDINNLDGLLLSPVLDEIPVDIFQGFTRLKKDKFIMLDPQGFLRTWDKRSLQVTYKNQVDINFKGISGIKTDEEELSVLTNGITSLEGMKFLQNKYSLEFVISTGNRQAYFLNKNILYSLTFNKFQNLDSTGLGDILSSGFSCSYLKEKDPLWAFCFGAGAVVASLFSKLKGLEKVPRKMNLIERNASYFYNTVKFKVVD